MRAFRAHRRLGAWIAALAILWASLAPSLGHALASASGTGWIEICTTQGYQRVADDGTGAERSPASAQVLGHCPYCSLHAPALGLPPESGSAQRPARPAHAVPSVFLAAPFTLHARVSAQPRAPPRFS